MNPLQSSLAHRAQFIQGIRAFFAQLGVLEVQTPTLLSAPTTDLYIDSLSVRANQDLGVPKTYYLHTSPELEMKKLLSQGSGDIYQICSVFRDNEQGENNHNEFTMLEYYRVDFDMHQLMDDITQLIQHLGIESEVQKRSYAQVFSEFADIDILNTSFDVLKTIAKSHGLSTDFDWIEDLQILLFVHLIEPKLAELGACFIYDYPHQQAALAKVEGLVAKRFELYIDGLEIANGYDELQSVKNYQARFQAELDKRAHLGKPVFEPDSSFLAQLDTSLPQCAGVAIGLDRLLTKTPSTYLK